MRVLHGTRHRRAWGHVWRCTAIWGASSLLSMHSAHVHAIVEEPERLLLHVAVPWRNSHAWSGDRKPWIAHGRAEWLARQKVTSVCWVGGVIGCWPCLTACKQIFCQPQQR